MKKYILIFIFALIHGFTAGLQAQGIAVSGKVSDKNGQELVGVAVIETGTYHATVSAADGSYKLTVSGKNARLEFRMLGYIPQEITVGSRTAIDIILEEGSATKSSLSNMDEIGGKFAAGLTHK